MAINSKAKGKRGELAWCRFCGGFGYTVRRTGRSPCGERGFKIRGSCQATITGNVSGWQMVHLWCYSLSDCDWRKGCGSIFKKTR